MGLLRERVEIVCHSEPEAAEAVEERSCRASHGGVRPESNSAPTKCSGWRARQPSQDAALGTQGKTVPAVSDAKSVIGKYLGESKRRVDMAAGEAPCASWRGAFTDRH